MKKSILIGGEAGRGTDKTAALLGEIFSAYGYFCFIYRDYGSFIKGGHNFSVITVSSEPVFSHENRFDVIIALDEAALEKHVEDLKPDGLILLNSAGERFAENMTVMNTDGFSISKKIKRSFGNNIFIGAALKYFGIDWMFGWRILKKGFNQTDAAFIKEALQFGWDSFLGLSLGLKPQLKKLEILTGNQAAGRGAIKSGLELCFAYPITPATGFVDALAQSRKVVIHQPEDEIAAINNALGASFSGAMTAVATSGEGAALMAESFSLAAMAEVPLVLYWAERLGPSTGVPTYTSQGDLKFALNIGHGEFPRIVVAPGDATEACLRTAEAFYLSYKYRIPAIVLTDKHLAESYYNFEDPKITVRPGKFLEESKSDYKSYALTPTGVSPRLVPGGSQTVRVTSYEHDEYGLTTEDPEMIESMNMKRWRKNDFLENEVVKLRPIRVFGRGKNIIVGWGSVKGAVIDALKELPGYSFLQISYIAPFPKEQVDRLLKQANRITLLENNFTGLLGKIIKEETGIEIKDKLLKNDGRPFVADEIVKYFTNRK